MDSESPPLSPLISHATRREAVDRQRKGRRSSSDVQSKDLHVTSSRDLARLLVNGEREANELRKMVLTVTEQLKEESQRADENERRAREALFRFKSADEARVAALQDAARATEELRLYKIQLEYAQKEIYRAQEVLNSIEEQRFDAEASAARARTTARQIKEERLIDLAREEGRRLGLQEGLTRGQQLGFTTGRYAGYEQARSDTSRPVYADDERLEEELPYEPPIDQPEEDQGLTPIEEDMINFPPPTPPPQRATSPGPPPPPPHDSPRSSSHRSSRAPVILVEQPSRQPTPVHNIMSPVRHPANAIPPDNWIPRVDEDLQIRLPPPHEMQAAPPTPEALRPLVPEEEPPLMVPNPASRRSSGYFVPPEQHQQPRREHRQHRQHRPARVSSPESQGSTTISQFELVSEPYGTSSGQMRGSHLSPIPEAMSSHTTPAYGTRSISSSRPGSVAPQGSGRGSPNPVPMNVPVPQVAQPTFANSEDRDSHHIYRRPSMSSTSSSRKSETPSRTPLGSSATLRRKSSSSVPDITIQPPSRPSSQTPQQTPVPFTGEFLTPETAARMPLPPDPAPPRQAPSVNKSPAPHMSYSTYSPSTEPRPLPADGQLPPGFIPMGGAMPSAPSPSQHSPRTNATNLPVMSPLYQSQSENSWGTPQVPVAFPTAPVALAYPTAPIIPGENVDIPGQGIRSRRNKSRLESDPTVPSTSSTARSSVVVPAPSLLGRPEPSSSDSEDIAVRSDIASSDDTLTTPPPSHHARRAPTTASSKTRSKKSSSSSKGAKTPKRQAYVVADLPPGLQYPSSPIAGGARLPGTPGTTTSVAAARVPLPSSSSAGTARTVRSHATAGVRDALNGNAGMTPGMRSASLRGGEGKR